MAGGRRRREEEEEENEKEDEEKEEEGERRKKITRCTEDSTCTCTNSYAHIRGNVCMLRTQNCND